MTAIQLAAQKPATVPVFVTSVGAVHRLTDPNKDNQDSVKDLRESLTGHKGLTVTDRRDDAMIVLTVMSREYTRAGFGSDPTYTVHVKFIYKDIETDLSGSIRGELSAWRRAADKVANQVDAWVKVNRARLAQ